MTPESADPTTRGNAAGELRICPNDGEPVIFTFKYPGAAEFKSLRQRHPKWFEDAT